MTRVWGDVMAFVRRKGNLFYLVHNVRRGGKVLQLHLARLGDRAQITDEVVREVSKKHPFMELNWSALREQLSTRVDLVNPHAPRSKSWSPLFEPSISTWRKSFRRSSEFPNRPQCHGSCWCNCGSCSRPFRSSSTSLAVDAGDSAVRTRLRGLARRRS